MDRYRDRRTDVNKVMDALRDYATLCNNFSMLEHLRIIQNHLMIILPISHVFTVRDAADFKN